MSPEPKPWIIYAVIAANLALFAVELASGASVTAISPQQLIALGGNFPPLTLHGEPWRLIASMFLHIGAAHIALNMLCLYQARIVEAMYGRLGFAALYLVAGLGGGIANLLVGPENIVTVGASGAVFGIYGAFGAFLVLRRGELDPEVWQRTGRKIGSFLVLNLVIGFTIPGISVSAHVGGLIVGFLGGAALLAGPGATAQRTARTIGVVVAGLALTAVAVLTIHSSPGVGPVLNRFDAIEHATITQWNATVVRLEAGELKPADVAQILEHDILPPYKKIRQDLLATESIPPKLEQLFLNLDAYLTARVNSWETFDKELRETDPARKKVLRETYEHEKAEVETRLDAFNAEAIRLKKQ